MKTSNKEKIDLVKHLMFIQDTRKAAEKVEKEIKDQLREIMGEDMILEADGLIVLRKECTRSSIDRDLLLGDMGPHFVLKYTQTSEYETLTVQKLKKAEIA